MRLAYASRINGGSMDNLFGFHKAKEQEDDHLIKIKTLLRRDLISQIERHRVRFILYAP